MFNQCQPAEAIERYAGDVYIQHHCNQTWPNDHDYAGVDDVFVGVDGGEEHPIDVQVGKAVGLTVRNGVG
jgi:hypothetical protein